MKPLPAGLVLALVAVGCAQDRPTPSVSQDRADLTRPTSMPWWDDGLLHVDGALIRTRERELVHVPGTTLVGHASFDRGSAWWLVEGDRLVPVVEAATLVQPVLTSDGAAAVWVESTPVGGPEFVSDVGELESTLVRYDLRSREVTATWTTRYRVFCCDRSGDLHVAGIDDAGRVLLTLGFRDLVWIPGRDPIPARLVLRGQPEADGLRSPDGTAYAHRGRDHVWVERTDGVRTDLALPELPEGAIVEPAVWETPTDVLLEVRLPYEDADDPDGGVLGFVRCDADTGACAITVDEPGRRALLPDPVLSRWAAAPG